MPVKKNKIKVTTSFEKMDKVETKAMDILLNKGWVIYSEATVKTTWKKK